MNTESAERQFTTPTSLPVDLAGALRSTAIPLATSTSDARGVPTATATAASPALLAEILTPEPIADSAVVAELERVVEAKAALQSGQIKAVSQQLDGLRSETNLRFDLGDDGRAPRLRRTIIQETPSGISVDEFIVVGERVWQRQNDTSWTESAGQPSVDEQVQSFLPDVESASNPNIEVDGDTTVVQWYDAEADAEVTVRVDSHRPELHEWRRETRNNGSVLTVIYSDWNTFVDIISPEGT